MWHKILLVALLCRLGQCVQIESTGRTINVDTQQTREVQMDCTVRFQGGESLLANLVYWFKIQNLTIVETFNTDIIVSAKLNNQDTTISEDLELATEFTEEISSLLALQNPFDDSNKFRVTNAETGSQTNTISLTIRNLEPQDSGLYVCAVKQSGNSRVLTTDYRVNILQQVNNVMVRGHANYTYMQLMNMTNMNNNNNWNNNNNNWNNNNNNWNNNNNNNNWNNNNDANNMNNMDQGSSLIYYENTDGFFECRSEGGFPAPHLSVFIGEQRMSGFGLNREYTNYTLNGDLGGRQTITPIRWINSTTFRVNREMNNMPLRCQAEVRAADMTFQNRTVEKKLVVYYKPKIECDESTIKIPLGGRDIPVECKIDARPVPEITWHAVNSRADVKSNDANSRNNLGLEAVTETTNQADVVTARLIFKEVRSEHFQEYKIKAENDAGEAYIEVTIKDGELKIKEFNSASSLSSAVLLTVLAAALHMLFNVL